MSGHKVLNLDHSETYGGVMADFNFKQFMSYFAEHADNKNELVELVEQKLLFKPGEVTDELSKECTIEFYPKYS